MNQRGFSLLEVLVATLVMAIAVAGLLGSLSTSMRSAARLTERDRAVLLAKQKMDELLLVPKLPKNVPFEGRFEPALAGGLEAGWHAQSFQLLDRRQHWRRWNAVGRHDVALNFVGLIAVLGHADTGQPNRRRQSKEFLKH